MQDRPSCALRTARGQRHPANRFEVAYNVTEMSPRKALIPLLLALLVAAGISPLFMTDPGGDPDGSAESAQPSKSKDLTAPISAPGEPAPSEVQDRAPIDAPADQPRTELVILRADTREPVPG